MASGPTVAAVFDLREVNPIGDRSGDGPNVRNGCGADV